MKSNGRKDITGAPEGFGITQTNIPEDVSPVVKRDPDSKFLGGMEYFSAPVILPECTIKSEAPSNGSLAIPLEIPEVDNADVMFQENQEDFKTVSANDVKVEPPENLCGKFPILNAMLDQVPETSECLPWSGVGSPESMAIAEPKVEIDISSTTQNYTVSMNSSAEILSFDEQLMCVESTDQDESSDKDQLLNCSSLKSMPGSEKFPCEICGDDFSDVSELRIHMKHHTGEKTYSCPLCEKCFETRLAAAKHFNLSHNPPITCTLCGRKCNTIRALRTHKLFHTGEKPHMCEYCGMCFTTKGKLKEHLVIHKKMATPFIDTGHFKLHGKGYRYAKKVATPSNHTGHFKLPGPGYRRVRRVGIPQRNSPSNKSKGVTSINHYPDSGHSFAMTRNEMHWRSSIYQPLSPLNWRNQKQKGMYVCSLCQEELASQSDLVGHAKRIHSIYTCENCTSTFGSISAMVEHKIGTFSCKICGKGFACAGKMKNHKCSPGKSYVKNALSRVTVWSCAVNLKKPNQDKRLDISVPKMRK